MSVWPNTLTSIRKDGFFTEGRPPTFNMLTCLENLLNISLILSSTFLPHSIISHILSSPKLGASHGQRHLPVAVGQAAVDGGGHCLGTCELVTAVVSYVS